MYIFCPKGMPKRQLSVLIFISLFISAPLQAQLIVDENKIPYGLGDGDLYMVFQRVRTLVYGEYTIPREGYVQPGMTQDIHVIGLREFKYSSIGGGLNIRIPMIYAFTHSNKKRLRIADDFGMGLFMASNGLRINEALTDTELKYDKDKSSRPAVAAGFDFHLGMQGVYRISNTFDAGLKFTPLFAHSSTQIKVTGISYSLMARIKRVYLEYRITKMGDENKIPMVYDHNGYKHLNIKYLLPEGKTFRPNGYVFISYTSIQYIPREPFGYMGTPAAYQDYNYKPHHNRLLKIGLGLMLM